MNEELVATPQATAPVAMPGTFRRALRVFGRDRTAVAGALLALLFTVMAAGAPWIAPHSPTRQSILHRLKAPGTASHWLGTDDFGRDVLSRVIWGSRVSLVVGVGSVGVALAVGLPAGMIAGFKGGRVDQWIMRAVDVLMAFPTLIFGLLVAALLGPGMGKLMLAIGVAIAPRFARLARGSTLALREMEFVQASRAVGNGDARTLLFHVLPNIAGEVTVMATLWVATAIRTEANLSFVGLGVAPPQASWGGMIRDGLNLLGTAPWLSIVPGVAIFLAALSFNLLGDGLRDALDPKSRSGL